ncbi:MAG: sterol carrier family protein [Actinomycetaceae bacterium]|nr:sterol carrier family protein [Actinomycetaceae bacterium]
MAKRRIANAEGHAALKQWAVEPSACARGTIKTAVRWSLEELAERAPGRSVEVRVPPYGATQIIGGVTHRRGTPPAVVEMSATTWLALVTGQSSWESAVQAGLIQASGHRADLEPYLPLT